MSSKAAPEESMEKRAGLLLLAASALALLLANSPLAHDYHHVLELRFGPALPRLGKMSLHQWIADAAMAIFFLLVGLEVKREWIEGRLAGAAERRLPIVAAAAGMAMPALVYLAVTGFDPQLVRGWAIPAATDIAFAIGVLAILGRHAPASIKLLLVTIAIVDDIGAVIVIALAYTADLDLTALAGALGLAAAMAALGRFGVRKLWPFLTGFVLLWLLLLASGVHPTIAGVLAALTVPLAQGEARSPLKRLATCDPPMGDVPHRPPVRPRLGRRLAQRRPEPADPAAPARRRARPADRQAARRVQPPSGRWSAPASRRCPAAPAGATSTARPCCAGSASP